MKRMVISFAAILAVGLSLSAFAVKYLFDEKRPLLTIGGDASIADHVGAYKAISRFCTDEKGNIYIGDVVECRIDKYDPSGKYLASIGKKGQGPFGDVTVNALDQSPDVLRVLKKRGQFMPRIFGIALDKGRMFVWTSEQDDEFRFIIDIYDRDFKPLGKAALYDFLPRRSVSIKNGRVYSPDMRSDDMALKRSVHR